MARITNIHLYALRGFINFAYLPACGVILLDHGIGLADAVDEVVLPKAKLRFASPFQETGFLHLAGLKSFGVEPVKKKRSAEGCHVEHGGVLVPRVLFGRRRRNQRPPWPGGIASFIGDAENSRSENRILDDGARWTHVWSFFRIGLRLSIATSAIRTRPTATPRVGIRNRQRLSRKNQRR